MKRPFSDELLFFSTASEVLQKFLHFFFFFFLLPTFASSQVKLLRNSFIWKDTMNKSERERESDAKEKY